MFAPLLNIFLSLVLGLASSVSCDVGNRGAFAHPLLLPQDVPADTVIILKRLDCYGGCPVYTVTIYADGRVLYVGKNEVKTRGEAEGRISQEKVKELIAAFKEIDYYFLWDNYTHGKEACPKFLHDLPYAFTSLTMNKKEKRVTHYYGCMGSKVVAQLTWLEGKIDEAVNADQWIK